MMPTRRTSGPLRFGAATALFRRRGVGVAGYDDQVTDAEGLTTPVPGTPRPSSSVIPQVVEWVGTAIGAGVTGNAAYDLIKKAMRRNQFARNRLAQIGSLRTAPGSVVPVGGPVRSLMDYTARAAIVVQCNAHGLPAPAFAELRVGRWKRVDRGGRTYHEAPVRSRFKSPFAAEVSIPEEDLDERGVEVTIHQAITWEKTTRLD
jgi:hypothetical protein